MTVAVRQVSPIGSYPGYNTSGVTATNSFSEAVLTGSTLVTLNIAGAGAGSPTISVSDSINGSYTQAAQIIESGTTQYPIAAGHFFPNAAAGSPTITGTSSATAYNAYGFMYSVECTGVTTASPLDQSNTNSSAGSTTPTSNSITPTTTSGIAFAVLSQTSGTNQTYSEPNGFTNVGNVGTASTYLNTIGSCDYQIYSSESAISAAWGTTSSLEFAAVIFNLKASTASAPPALMGQILT